MGMFSVVLISHDGLDQIEKDPNFGKNLSKAIGKLAVRSDSSYRQPIPAGNHTNPAEVIGHYFHGDTTKFVVIEGGTGWIANGQRKPDWSKVNFELVKRMFAGVKRGF